MRQITLLLLPLCWILLMCISCSESIATDEVKRLVLSSNDLTLQVGESSTLIIEESPSATASVNWTSSDESVAEVNAWGGITALNSGTSIVKATMGEYVDSCTVLVPERTYQLVWEEEFNGDALDLDVWTYEVNGNGGGNNELQYYSDRTENLRVADGLLTIEARKEEYLGKSYTSARIITKEKKDFTYGKVEVRLKVPSGRGTWPAFWMLGYGSWPDAGEIDIMEHVGYDPNTFHCALHTKNKNGMNGKNEHGDHEYADAVANDFHVITMEWVEKEYMGFDRIHISIDGEEIQTFAETTQLQDSGDWPFNDPFFFIINLAIGGSWGGAQGVDDTMFDVPVLYQIDYIKVYQLQ